MEETNLKGIERLKTMLEEFKDGYSLKPVVEYLITRTDMDEKFQNEDKNLNDMEKHIKEKARSQAVHNVSMISDNMVYSWAVLYFTLSNELLGIKKEVPKKPEEKDAVIDVKEVESEIQKVDTSQISIFEEVV